MSINSPIDKQKPSNLTQNVNTILPQLEENETPKEELTHEEKVLKIVHSLPTTYKNAILRICDCYEAPYEWGLITSLLSVASSIGTGAFIKYDAYSQFYGNMYGLIIADQGGAKSPVTDAFLIPIYKIQSELNSRYANDMDEFRTELAKYDKLSKKEKNNAEYPIKPIPQRIVVNDETQENIIVRMSVNPKGILCDTDEMATLLDKTHSGKDIVDFLNKSYQNKAHTTGRKTVDEDINVDRTYLSVLYNTQPQTARKKFFTEKNLTNGFCARHLVSSAEEREPSLELPQLEEGELDNYIEAIHKLYFALPTNSPVSVQLSKDAKSLINYIRYQSKIMRLETLSPTLKGIYGKRMERVLKVSLNLHFMKWSDDKVNGIKTENHVIEIDTVRLAIDIVDLTVHTFIKLLEGTNEDVEDRIKKVIINLVAKNKHTFHDGKIIVQVRDIQRAAQSFISTKAELEILLAECKNLGFLDVMQGKTNKKQVFTLSTDFRLEISDLRETLKK